MHSECITSRNGVCKSLLQWCLERGAFHGYQAVAALKLQGREPGHWRIVPYFWLPEETARQKDHLAPFLTWAASGHLTLTPGSVLDYGFVKARFRALAKLFRIQILAYDQMYAEEVTQTLEQGQTDDKGVVIEEGTGVPREVFKQGIMSLADPTAEFERNVVAHTLHHDGHPVLAWQAGHVNVWTDANNNRRPIKPKGGDHRKIDGIVAGIMALAKAITGADGVSIYETQDLEIF